MQQKYIEFSDSILSAGQRMSGVVGDVLTIAQLEAGTFELEWDEVDLCSVAREAIEKFQHVRADRGGDIAFEAEIDSIPVHADTRSVEQMISKLLSNAAKFSETGTPINLSIATEKDGSARLSVKDKGIGMTEAEADAAIRPFRQVDERMERKYEVQRAWKLSIVNKLIESHHGHLTINQRTGGGDGGNAPFSPAPRRCPKHLPRLVAA